MAAGGVKVYGTRTDHLGFVSRLQHSPGRARRVELALTNVLSLANRVLQP